MKTKILVVGPTPPPYHGVSVSFKVLLSSSLTEIFDITHLDIADRRGIQHVNNPDLYDVLIFCKQLFQLVILVNKIKFNIAYFAISQSKIGFIRDSLFIWLCSLFGIKIIIHLHGGNFGIWYNNLAGIIKNYVKLTFYRINYAIVLGKVLKENFLSLVAEDKIFVVPNGIGECQFKNKKNEAKINRIFRILYLGTLNPKKGVSVLLKAIPLILKKNQDINFNFTGEWVSDEYKSRILNFVSKNNLEKFITFTGQLTGKEKDRAFQSADLFVFPGIQQEGQPLVVIEAMAAGLPVIYTDRGCLRETVINGINGLEVKIDDVSDLAEKILWIVKRPNEIERMGKKSRERYEELFTAKNFVYNMIETFKSIA